ncbi:carbon starvation CstA family protein [Flavonifractor sp. An100]|uniref:carbon starvation CstA family protein n=1 Tax=Flavonifractor sp. An100 TaxID=1965538 RepID=UPI000B36857D|nr:carbon starvation CstA family protein [Flavonifractor sp. An100]OUQ80630.1 carbon starvation protein A [Flavonifractor sp. An100]
MITFLVSLVVLLVGFALYSKLIEKVFCIDDRQTPAVAHPDGVDYTPMKTWRLFLVQLLNIAGLGPIFGALSGACWGPRVYLWIVFGTILGGGVHDFMSGMMSERHDGASISEIVGMYLGKFMLQVMRVFSVILLILVGVNFSKNPAALLASLTPEQFNASFWLVVVLIYYFIATFLPIDKIIGKLYPIFGACLIIMALGLMGVMLVDSNYRSAMPEMWQYVGVDGMGHPDGTPIWAQMFVTVACGAISGFHATQSPMVARCMTSEKEGRKVFYGAMVAEGVIALVWAAAGVTFYGNVADLNEVMVTAGGSEAVNTICRAMMGPIGGILALLGVIACPITSGDTAFRSARLTIADWFHIDQSHWKNRLLLSVPVLGVGALITQWGDFATLWKYFSWSNQTLAMMVLWAGAVYLHRNGFPPVACFMCALPATFMSAVSVTYFIQAPECLNMSTSIAYPVGIVVAILFLAIFLWREWIARKGDVKTSAAA